MVFLNMLTHNKQMGKKKSPNSEKSQGSLTNSIRKRSESGQPSPLFPLINFLSAIGGAV